MRIISFLKENMTGAVLSAFFLFALFNPVFKKFDYGAGFPLVIGFGVLLALFLWSEYRVKREKPRLEPAFLLIFMAAVLMSFVYSQTKNIGFPEVMGFLTVGVFYLIFAYNKNKWTKAFLWTVGLSLLLAIFLGFFFYFTKGEVRMVGPFFNIWYKSHQWPNAFALFILTTWPVFLLIFKGKYNFVKVLGLSLILSALLLTYSRGAFIAFIGQIVLLGIYFARSIRVKTVVLTLLIAILGTGIFYGANLIRSQNFDVVDLEEKVAFDNAEGITSKTERVDFWKGAITLTKERPLLGWGPFSFRYAYNGIQDVFLGSSDHPHNVFLKISAENGVIALFGFVGFLLMLLLTVWQRFSFLDKKERDFVYILGVAVAGAFAHNLIDYNWNFYVNLLLIFVFLALIRSTVAMPSGKERSPINLTLVTILLSLFSLMQGCILVLGYTVDTAFIDYFLYPRLYHILNAQDAINADDFETALYHVDEEISLNPLDGQAYYHRGQVYCDNDFAGQDLEICRDNFAMAIEKDPMNDLKYYREYFRVADKAEIERILPEVEELLNTYFYYVDFNVHFTGYTDNVEAASDLVDMILPYVTDGDDLLAKREKMLKKAAQLRAEKVF
jgi:putative inorganic carbon (hco3(-)) transporter